MRQFYNEHKKEIFLFLLMLFLELAMIFVLSQKNGIDIFFRNDANEFQILVKNIINHRDFSLETSAPFLPTNFRTPGYVSFLLIIYLIFSSFKPAIFIGAAIFALSAPLAYLIGKEIFQEKIAFLAAILFAIEPWAIFQSGFLIAEQIFLPVFLLSIYLFCGYLKENNRQLLYWSSLFMGLAVLTRPLALFFIIIFIVFAFISEFRFSFKKSLTMTVLTFLIFILILSPWIIRNKIVLNTWKVSSVSDVSLYIENYAMLEKYLGKMKPDEDINEVGRLFLGTKSYGEAQRANNAQILANVALREIKANFGSYLKMHFQALPLFLIRNSYGNIFFDLKISGADIQSDIGRNLLNKDFASLFVLVKNASISSKILIVMAFFWPIIIILAIIGIFAKFKADPRNLIFWFLILWLGYFFALTGNLRDISRYKLAVNAPLFAFAVFGFYRIYNFLKNSWQLKRAFGRKN